MLSNSNKATANIQISIRNNVQNSADYDNDINTCNTYQKF